MPIRDNKNLRGQTAAQARAQRRWYAFLYGGLLPETNLPLYRLSRK